MMKIIAFSYLSGSFVYKSNQNWIIFYNFEHIEVSIIKHIRSLNKKYLTCGEVFPARIGKKKLKSDQILVKRTIFTEVTNRKP